MTDSDGFKLPSLISQDIALIMSYIDPPTPLITGPGTSDAKVSKQEEDDINSSGPEDEAEEVENELLKGEGIEVTGEANGTIKKNVDSSISDSSDSSDSDSAEDEDGGKNENQAPGFKRQRRNPDLIEVDLDEDGPSVPNDYVPTTHEIPLISIPIPPLPDSSTLPDEPLELVGEIATILSDTIIVRGGGGSASGYTTAKERRDAVLDEGSLLLLDDRTSLGYVWETFGPTHLPHYIVRIPRRAKTPEVVNGAETDQTIEAANNNALLDKATLFRPIYHMRSMSKFVFTETLSKLKGSDASNIHDEELPEHEQEFSDDEAEATFKRSRRKGSRAPSVSRSSSQYHDSYNESPGPDYADDAGSLYGDSPYDIEGSNPSFQNQNQDNPTGASTSRGLQTFPTAAVHQNPELQRALQNARMSRKRRPSQVGMPSRSFSYEEYDPRMPRPPSPTSFAIAQATGQWPNGIPFTYGLNAPAPYAQPNGYNYFPPVIHTPDATPHINPHFIPPFSLPSNTDHHPGTYTQNDASMEG
ncbi:hypothetical protein Clacol_006937 [Clathrus columnatus]|uniref:H/ACA ribonucleoprotein complex non-core subunit NAF1 n=1 Tax=Clathrus columnatus TaxID=1419009 RepID=A0AAV5AGS7_9AGAM|nr:hypothetical protein Clacol_006937 [Clathrus columnatus]